MRRVGIASQVTFTGGVARNPAMRQLIDQALGEPANVSEDSHYCGALGAALFALDHLRARSLPQPRPAAGSHEATS
jgi:sugar (pentulose or hexulose) kinase